MGACLSRRRRKRPPPADAADDKMTKSLAIVRTMVSKKKKRYVADGFDLDLSYVTRDLIAMGIPSEKLERLYRNNIDDVVKFLEKKHKDRYKIYNLCSERSYDVDKFHKRVAMFPFDDHNPPKIDLIHKFCLDVHHWLTAHELNVAVVHCKAGKGRTGTMICCYLLYSGRYTTAAASLDCFARERTHDQKGVTIPSQKRYVEYYAALLALSAPRPTECMSLYNPPTLKVTEFIMRPPPMLNGGQGALEFYIFAEKRKPQKVGLGVQENKDGSASYVRAQLGCSEPFRGNVRVDVYNVKPKIKIGKEKLFHFWFDTYFVEQGIGSVKEGDSENATYRLTFNKQQLDDAHKDTQNKIFSDNFNVQLLMRRDNEYWDSQNDAMEVGRLNSPPSPSSSCAEEGYSDESLEPEEGWDSGTAGGTGALLSPYRRLSELELDDMPDGALAPTLQPEVERMLQA